MSPDDRQDQGDDGGESATIDQIIASLTQGRKIEAIKRYRELTGRSLADSKLFVDNLEAELHKAHPELFSSPKRAGCGATALLLLAGAIAWLSAI